MTLIVTAKQINVILRHPSINKAGGGRVKTLIVLRKLRNVLKLFLFRRKYFLRVSNPAPPFLKG